MTWTRVRIGAHEQSEWIVFPFIKTNYKSCVQISQSCFILKCTILIHYTFDTYFVDKAGEIITISYPKYIFMEHIDIEFAIVKIHFYYYHFFVVVFYTFLF